MYVARSSRETPKDSVSLRRRIISFTSRTEREPEPSVSYSAKMSCISAIRSSDSATIDCMLCTWSSGGWRSHISSSHPVIAPCLSIRTPWPRLL